MRIAIVSDAWEPQVNGVVRTLRSIRTTLERQGHELLMISPDRFATIACPTYPEIRLALAPLSLGRRIREFAPDHIHIATEGPLGLAARHWCLRRNFAFTTAYHTQFPEYIAARTNLPASWFWRYIRWFHAPSQAVLAATQTVRAQLSDHGISHSRHWGRGVDLAQFTPDAVPPALYASLERPIQLYVGRVAVEKNIEAFLASSHPGTKVVVGDGPAKAELQTRFPDAVFMGAMGGAALAGAYAGADVFVFPSQTDTFGLVIIEALACGVPVAAFPVSGPLDILTVETGAMRSGLTAAIAKALTLDRATCAAYGRSFSWERSAQEFVAGLVPLQYAAHGQALATA